MNNDTRGYLATIIAFALGALFLVLFALNASAAPAQVCPEEGKVESIVDGDIDNIVLEKGTEVCIFGASVQINVIADGSSTLRDLLGLDKNVSHYTVLESSTTTTTTSTPTTTTTTVKSTTTSTTTPSSTTTIPKETTTTTPTSTTTTGNPTTTAPSTTTTPEPTTTTTSPESTGSTLPFTGMNDPLVLSGLALSLLASGGLMLAATRKE